MVRFCDPRTVAHSSLCDFVPPPSKSGRTLFVGWRTDAGKHIFPAPIWKAVEPYLSAGALMQGNTFSLHLFESAEVRVNARGEGKKSTEREGGGERNRAVGGKPP